MDITFLVVVLFFWWCLLPKRRGEVCLILEQPSDLLETSVISVSVRGKRYRVFLKHIDWRKTRKRSRAMFDKDKIVIWTLKAVAYQVFTEERLKIEKERSRLSRAVR